MELGHSVKDSELQSRIDTLAPNKCASLIYTVSIYILHLIRYLVFYLIYFKIEWYHW
jgi:hypothetical protein